jgi:cytochrome c-type biogenesis protein CcmH/NrfG
VNRDNVLFLCVGLLVGFIGGYLVHEAMATRQPPRVASGSERAAAQPPAPTTPAAPDGAAPEAGTLEAKRGEIRQVEAHLAANPDDAQALLQLANLDYDVRDWQGCADAYERYFKLRPEDPDIVTDQGTCYRGSGDPQKALELFRKARSLDPKHWQSVYNEVVVLAFDLRDYAAAARALDDLRALQSDNPDVQRLADEVARQRGAA